MLAVFTWNQEELWPSRQLCGSGLPYHQKNWGKSKTWSASIPLVFAFFASSFHTSFMHIIKHFRAVSLKNSTPTLLKKNRGVVKKTIQTVQRSALCHHRNGGSSFVEGWCLFPPQSKHVDVVVPPAKDVKDPRSSSPEESQTTRKKNNQKKNTTHTWMVTQDLHGHILMETCIQTTYIMEKYEAFWLLYRTSNTKFKQKPFESTDGNWRFWNETGFGVFAYVSTINPNRI